MVDIGNTTLPGIQTTVESSSSTSVNVGSPANVGIVGTADLATGTAQANELQTITTPIKARNVFGDEEDSPLTVAVVQALTEGAYPVYAVAADGITETQDISGEGSTSITLANSPASEDTSEYTITVDSNSKTVIRTFDNPANKSVSDGESYVNPVEGEVELDAAPSTSGSIEYTHYDYTSAISELRAEAGEVVDFVGATWENSGVTSEFHTVVREMEKKYNFAIVCAGHGTYVSDYNNVQAAEDSSRLQEYFPLRDGDGNNIIGAVLGLRASIGMENSAMNKTLDSVTDLRVTLSPEDQIGLTEGRVNPIANESSGARLVDDMTTVTTDNLDEQNWNQGISRIVTDYVTEVVNDISEPYIGEFHSQDARNSLRGQIVGELKELRRLNAITGFTIIVEEQDSMTATVDVGIETIDPLRNIIATVTAGEVN